MQQIFKISSMLFIMMSMTMMSDAISLQKLSSSYVLLITEGADEQVIAITIPGYLITDGAYIDIDNQKVYDECSWIRDIPTYLNIDCTVQLYESVDQKNQAIISCRVQCQEEEKEITFYVVLHPLFSDGHELMVRFVPEDMLNECKNIQQCHDESVSLSYADYLDEGDVQKIAQEISEQEEPSQFTVYIQELGVAILLKYLDIKEYLAEKWDAFWS